MGQDYDMQARGDDSAYHRYLTGMDQSMRQKVAMTAAHFLGEGTVADMGMGSGSGSAALASLYPRLKVIGVDVNSEMVSRAEERFKLSNLTFVLGDVAARIFPEGSLAGIFDSSVLHHVTSFNGYNHEAALVALKNQVAQLKYGGTLVVRDFLSPSTGLVLLDLPDNDGDSTSSPGSCSSARLLERFSTEFRALGPTPGFALEELCDAQGLRAGWRRFALQHRFAVEFLLRKDYRDDWESEVLEEYTYFTQARFEQAFAELGLRLLASIPIKNPWIFKHRFDNRLVLRDLAGDVLDSPPTNYLIAGERVTLDQGLCFELGSLREPIGFLHRHVFEDAQDQSLRDLVRRPGTSIDIVPWFRDKGALYVLVRRSHPRPILQACTSAPLDASSPVGYVTEPILAIMSDVPIAMTVEKALSAATTLSANDICSLREAGHYYPSPGGIVEEVRAVHVEILPCYGGRAIHNGTGFSTTGSVQAVDARQLLRAAQVGALPDARIELNVYELLLQLKEPLGPWIGADIEVPQSEDGPGTSWAHLDIRARRRYRNAVPGESSGFLELQCHDFVEKNAEGRVLFSAPRDYVVPKALSTNTVACALLRRHGDQVLIGVDEDDLPTAQAFTGSSALVVAPAWRIPKTRTTLTTAANWVREQLMRCYGLTVTSQSELGGRYHPSCGITPEIVYPMAVAVTLGRSVPSTLHWVPLLEIIEGLERVQDGHLRVLALRAAHALGAIA